MKNKKLKLRTYRVWLDQVNQTIIDVKAASLAQAEDKALRKWKREYGPQVSDSKEISQ